MKEIECFNSNYSYLICVDSDGCVINGMTAKHIKCFGPGIIEVFSLGEHKEKLLAYWEKINLHSRTRGINRFQGLVMALGYAVKKGCLDMDISSLVEWVDTTNELSNRSLDEWIEKEQEKEEPVSLCLTLAREWSLWVNQKVATLPFSDKQAFEEAKKALRTAKKSANVVVVSSANQKAVEEEWEENRLLDSVDLLMTQEYGSKASCLERLRGLGYDKNRILMIGDALGDMQAAKAAGVLFYPILPGKEEESWRVFHQEILPEFLKGEYKGSRMEEWQQRMLEYLQ